MRAFYDLKYIAELLLLAWLLPITAQAQILLRPSDFRHYVEMFRQQEKLATGSVGKDSFDWMAANIPLFDSSNGAFTEMYYFRWYVFEKHVVHTEKYGTLITEWLPKPESADGAMGVLPDATPFHLREARWLRDPSIAGDYARYWLTPGANPWKYSEPLADAIYQLAVVTGSMMEARSELPALERYVQHWDGQLDGNGLYWSIDTRDAMEKSISGDGYRPTLNSYMVADARAMAAFATDDATREKYTRRAEGLETLIRRRLWNPRDDFYEVVSPSRGSGIRREKKFVDPGTQLAFANVREAIGFIPWQYGIATPKQDVAWKQLFDPQGFNGIYGPTTAEKRHPRFRFASSDQCTWNGPMWPFATTQILTALAELLNTRPQDSIDAQSYYELFARYVKAQHLTLRDGRQIPWVDEDRDADADDWIARRMLREKNKQIGRGNYYNHSGFADPLITGLVGLRPNETDTVRLHPLLPAKVWQYFALDGVPYHGHLLTMIYDATGTHYKRGRGFSLFVDGRLVAHRNELGPLSGRLKKRVRE